MVAEIVNQCLLLLLMSGLRDAMSNMLLLSYTGPLGVAQFLRRRVKSWSPLLSWSWHEPSWEPDLGSQWTFSYCLGNRMLQRQTCSLSYTWPLPVSHRYPNCCNKAVAQIFWHVVLHISRTLSVEFFFLCPTVVKVLYRSLDFNTCYTVGSWLNFGESHNLAASFFFNMTTWNPKPPKDPLLGPDE